MGNYKRSSVVPANDNDARAIIHCKFDRNKNWHRVDAESFFQLNALLRKELVNQGTVANHGKSTRGSYVEKNFITCLKSRKEAVIAEYNDDQFHVESKYCQNKYCFSCADNRARREVRHHASYLAAIAEKFCCESVYQITFSFPEKLAATLHKKPDVENKARTKMRNLIHKFMLPFPNVKKVKVPLHESRHMVGKKNLMKIRMHYHYVVLCGICLVTLNADNNEHIIHNDTLSGVIPQTAWDSLNAQWHKFLRKIYKKNFSCLLRVHVKNCDLFGTRIDKEKVISSLLNYTARGFGKDFLEAPQYMNSKNVLIPVISGRDQEETLKSVSVKEYVEQWKFVRNYRKVAGVGLLYSKEKMGKVLGIKYIQEELKAVLIDYEDAEVITTHHNKDNSKLKTQHDVFIKTREGKMLPLPPDTYRFGMRGKIKYWASA